MAKEEAEVTPETEENVEETQPTEEQTDTRLDDLQAQLDAAQAEAVKNLELYKDSQRKESKIAERERKQDVLDTIPSLRQDVADNREYMETMATFMEQRLGQSEYTEQPISRSPFEDLRQRQEERRKTPAPKTEVKETESQVDPEDMYATLQVQATIDAMGWDETNPIFKKLRPLVDKPKEALELVQKESKAQRDREVEERYQAKLKETGVTTPETASPSGASLDDDAFTKDFSKGKRNSPEDFARMIAIQKKQT